MKLNLFIEPQQESGLTSAFRAQLAEIAFSANLDYAEQRLRDLCTAHFWKITRGGHHVAVNFQSQFGFSFRVAMIAERQS